MFDEMTIKNAPKFALFLEYENHFIYLSFQFCTTFFFQIMIALIHADIGQGRAISFVKK